MAPHTLWLLHLLTKFGRAGPENVWLNVMAYRPRCARSQTKYDAIDGRSRDNKKESRIKSFPLLFRVRTVKPQLIEKPRLFSLFSSFSISFCSKAAWMQGRTAFLRPAHVNPALHTSAFTVVFFLGGGEGYYACGALQVLWWLLCTSKVVKNSSMSSTVVFSTDWQQTRKEWNIR